MDSIVHLQHTIGNQAVLRLLHAQPDNLEVSSGTTAAARFGHDFSRISVHPKSPMAVQTQLAVNAPADVHEQEADCVFEQVMREPEPPLPHGSASDIGCPPCGTQPSPQPESFQTKRVEAGDARPTAGLPAVRDVLRSPGQPLDPATRAFMEPRFGYDFSNVRVHTDARADAAAAAVGARAFTVGADVVFRQGEFASQSEAGRALLAHELAHTIQQRAPQGASSSLDSGEVAAERGADRAAAAALAGRPGGPPLATGVRLARQPGAAGASGPSLKEQGDTVLRMYASQLADADGRGRSGIRFVVVNTGSALEPTHQIEALGELGPRPAGVAPLSESAAAELLRWFVIDLVVQYPGEHKAEVTRNDRGVMNHLRYERLSGPPAAPAVAAPKVAATPDSMLPDEVKQAMADRLAWARQQQQVITSTIAEQDPTKLKNLVWYVAPFAIVKVGTKVAKATGVVESTEGMVSTTRRAERLAAEAKQTRLAKIRAAAEERYVKGTIRDVETVEAETQVVNRPPETPAVKVDPRVRGYAHEDVALKFGDVRSTPSWFKTIDGYVADSASKTYTYVEGERTIIVYERPNVVSHKSTAIVDHQRLHQKIMKDIDALRGFNHYKLGNIEINGVGARRLVFTIDEEAALETENVRTLEWWRENLHDIDFDWYVSRGTEMIPGPKYIKALGLPEY